MLESGSLTPCRGCELYQLRLPETGEVVRELHPLAMIAVRVSGWLTGGPVGEQRFRETPIPLDPFEHEVVLQSMDVISELRTEREREMEAERQREFERERRQAR